MHHLVNRRNQPKLMMFVIWARALYILDKSYVGSKNQMDKLLRVAISYIDRTCQLPASYSFYHMKNIVEIHGKFQPQQCSELAMILVLFGAVGWCHFQDKI